jgi:hypothetical protein
MTFVRIHWKPALPAGTAEKLDMVLPPMGAEAFALGSHMMPDVFVMPGAFVLTNGLVHEQDPSLQRGLLSGQVAIDLVAPNAVTQLVAPTFVIVPDGRGKVLRVGKQSAPGKLPDAYRDEIMRGWKDIDNKQAAYEKVVNAAYPYIFDDSKYLNPDGAKEDRIIQAVWAGALAYALDFDKPDKSAPAAAFAAARHYVDQQFDLRPVVYYDAKGTPIGLVRKDIWIDEHGFRKGYHGKWKREAGTAAFGFGQMEDPEHLGSKRVHLAAAAGDAPARLFAKFHAQAVCTWPGVKYPKIQQQARAIGYQLEYLAHAAMVGALDDDQAQQCAGHVLEGTAFGSGKGVGGIPFFGCWPVGTTHTTHVSLNENGVLDALTAKGYCDWRGLAWMEAWDTSPPTAKQFLGWLSLQEPLGEAGKFTTGPEGYQTLMNGVTVWGIAIAGRGMAACKRRWPTLDLLGLAEDAARLIIARGCSPGINTLGKVFLPQQVHDSIAPRSWRARQANEPNNGTSRWCVSGFMDLAEIVAAPNDKLLRAAARRIVEHGPDLELADKGVKSIEVAGLLAVALFE